jgi:hypothetical protein
MTATPEEVVVVVVDPVDAAAPVPQDEIGLRISSVFRRMIHCFIAIQRLLEFADHEFADHEFADHDFADPSPPENPRSTPLFRLPSTPSTRRPPAQ